MASIFPFLYVCFNSILFAVLIFNAPLQANTCFAVLFSIALLLYSDITAVKVLREMSFQEGFMRPKGISELISILLRKKKMMTDLVSTMHCKEGVL